MWLNLADFASRGVPAPLVGNQSLDEFSPIKTHHIKKKQIAFNSIREKERSKLEINETWKEKDNNT